MKKLTLAEAREFLGELLENPEGEPVVMMRGKKPIAVILPVGDADMEIVSLSFSPAFNEMMRRTDRGKTYSSEEIRREFGLPPFDPERGKANGRSPRPRTAKRRAGTKARTSK